MNPKEREEYVHNNFLYNNYLRNIIRIWHCRLDKKKYTYM